MITKTRLQFLAAILLMCIPVLGLPTHLDSLLVFILGAYSAFATFSTARARRLHLRMVHMVESPEKVRSVEDNGASVEPVKRTRVRRRIVKKTHAVDAEHDGAQTPVIAEVKDVDDGSHHDEERVISEDMLAPVFETAYPNDSVLSPIASRVVVKKTSRRKMTTPIAVTESVDVE